MFGLFNSDPTKKLQKQHDQLLEKGMNAQRKGDMKLFAELTSQADELANKIKEIKSTKDK
jgi:hypothetical protein